VLAGNRNVSNANLTLMTTADLDGGVLLS
jgi:hypothetical protein